MVARTREIVHVHTTNLKQSGRRYGPSPNLVGRGGMAAPKGRRAAALAEKHARLEIAP